MGKIGNADLRADIDIGDVSVLDVQDISDVLKTDAAKRLAIDNELVAGVAPQMDNTNVPAVSLRGKGTVAGDTPVILKQGYMGIALRDGNGDYPINRLGAQDVDNQTATFNTLIASSIEWLYNESGWDKRRNNTEGTLLSLESASKATRNSADTVNYNHRGITIGVGIANLAGTPSFTPTLYWKRGDGSYVVIWQGAALTANGDYEYQIYPSVSGGAIDASAGLALPRTLRFSLVYAGDGINDYADTEAYHAFTL